MGGRAPLPGGVFALLRAGSVPRRGQPAHPQHPPRPRRHPAYHQPSGPRGGEGLDPRPPLRRTGGARPRRGAGAGGAASLRRAGALQARPLDRGREGHDPAFHRDRLRVQRRVLQLPEAQCRAEAAAEAASAALGRLLQYRDHRGCRALGHGGARLPVRLAGGGAGLGQPLLPQPHPQSRQDLRLPDQPQHRHGLGLHVLRDRRGSRREGGRVDLLHLLPQPLRPARHLRPRRDRPLEALPGLAPHGEGAAGADRRADRLAGHHPPQAARLRRRQCGPGDPAEPGRPEHA